jgi:hypothetical protein
MGIQWIRFGENSAGPEVQSDSFPGVLDQHDASGQFGSDALLADPLHPGTAARMAKNSTVGSWRLRSNCNNEYVK